MFIGTLQQLLNAQLLKRPFGRPTKYSEEVVARLCDALADGMPITGACVVAGISVSTLAAWRERHHDLEQRMTESRELARQKALRAIKSAGEKDWRAHSEWLKLTFRDDYCRKGNTIEISAINESHSGVIITEEMMRAIQDRHIELTSERAQECLTSADASDMD